MAASTWARFALPPAVFVALAAPAIAEGAYFPTSWGWAAIAFGWTAVLVLILGRDVRLSRLEWATLGGLAGFTGWIGLSAVWSEDVTQTVLEVERALVYLTAVLALLLILRPQSVPRLFGGALAAVVAVSAYGLATRLFPVELGRPDSFAVNRLAEPLGYWNALGIFAVLGVILALGLAAQARTLPGRALGGAAIPLLVSTLYLTFGRGPWYALGLGLLALLVLDARRLQLVTTALVLAAPAVVAVWLASRSDALATNTPVLAEASREGRRFAAVLLGLVALSGLAALALAYADRRVHVGSRLRLGYGAVLSVATAATVLALFVSYGSPWTLAERGYEQFRRSGVGASGPGADLNKRLLSFAGNGRADFWRIAWEESRADPWVGSGAGTYEQHWLRERPYAAKVRDAHSLYMEALVELGLVGLMLLVTTLVLPVAAAIRARRSRLVSALFGAYVAYLAHAGVDWDWEMPAVTLAGLFCGCALLASARDDARVRGAPRIVRGGVFAAAVAVSGLALVGLISNSALSASTEAARGDDWRKAESEARKASRWAPWSSAGWSQLGEAQLQQGKVVEAQESFRKAIAKDPGDWNLWLDLALASEGSARRNAALVALRLNPLSPQVEFLRPALGLGSGGG